MAAVPPDPPLPDGFDGLLGPRVAIVTGKGGVGKTTAVAALALAGVASGRRTLVVEVEGRQGLSRVFGTGAWDYRERQLRPDLWGVALDPSESVYEYLEMFYGIKHVNWALQRSHAIDFVTTAAPGLRDLLLIGKVYEIEARRRDGRRTYDLIVVDAPPTGRIVPFLRAPEAVTEIVRVGAIRRQAAKVRRMLHDPARAQAMIVTLLEEMPVQETVEATAALATAGLAVGPVIANQVIVARLDHDETAALERLGADGLRARAAASGADLDAATAGLTVGLAATHRRRLAHQHELRLDLAARTGAAILTLPLLATPTFGPSELEVLADALALQVGEAGPRASGLRAAFTQPPAARS